MRNNRGLALKALGRMEEAEGALREALGLSADRPEFHNNLGGVLELLGRPDEALESFRRALELQPDRAVALYNCGRLERLTDRLPSAVEHLRAATEKDPGMFEAWLELGRARTQIGGSDSAHEALRRALMLRPDDAAVLETMGDASHVVRKLGDAVAYYRRSLQADPDRVTAWYSLGCALLGRDESAEAIPAFRRCVELAPEDAPSHYQLGKSSFDMGRISEAVRCMQRAAEHAQDEVGGVALGHMAKFVAGDPEASTRDVLSIRTAWARGACRRPAGAPSWPDPEPVLRVGYVSAFFPRRNWMKPVWGLVNAHDRTRVEVHLFSDTARSTVGEPYSEQAGDRFHFTGTDDNAALAARVRAERIDVLVDLNGYSRPGRLPLFALRPAPVTVAWFNNFGTSGVPGLDHSVGDAVVAPKGWDEPLSEELHRVPGTYLAFRVGYPTPDVTAPPCEEAGHFTFGSLASQYKLTDQVLDAWARILRAAPDARLLLRNAALGVPANRNFVREAFAGRGVDAEQLTLQGPADHVAFVATYGRVDAALDPFPYNGGTTTMEALWQGVPVLCFPGDRWAARISASLLRAAGLDEFVAPDLDGHVEAAVRLATDPDTPRRLGELRAGMRERLLASPACDTEGLARAMEDLYDRLRR